MLQATRSALPVCLLVFSLSAASIAEGQSIITTFAGTDRTFAGNGQPALNVSLGSISALALDPAGNVVFADPSNSVVVRINPDRTLTVLAGNGIQGFSGDGGKAVNASLDHPESAAFDSAGNLYIADLLNQRIRKVTPDGVISTYAGNGRGGFSNGDTFATTASLNLPFRIAVDPAGNLYVWEAGNHIIRRITPAGAISVYAGNGQAVFAGDGVPARQASFDQIEALALDTAGNLYTADFADNLVRKINAQTGLITTVAGQKAGSCEAQTGSLPLKTPGGIALDSSGAIYISDTGNFRIQRLTPNGAITTVAGTGARGFSGDGGPAAGAALHSVFGMVFDSQNNLYLADRDNFRIRKISPDGTISTVAGNGARINDGRLATNAFLLQPYGVAAGSGGSIYISDTSNDSVLKVSGGRVTTVAGNGAHEFSGDGGPAASAGLSAPFGIVLDQADNLFIADTNNNRIRKVTSGVITTVAGGNNCAPFADGGFATQASLNAPRAVAVAPNGSLYIADTGNHRVRRVTNNVITTVAGADGILNTPSGLALDSAGNLYIADTGNRRIRKLTPSGALSVFAGGGSLSGAAADNGAATNADLGSVLGVTTDSTGNVYFTEIPTGRVRKVTPAGLITTVAGNGVSGFSGDGGRALQASLQTPYGLALSGGDLYIADSGNNRIRVVLAAAPSFQVAQDSLSFAASSNGAVSNPQVLNLITKISGLPFTVKITGAPWLKVDPLAGVMPATLQVSADPSNLDARTYEGSIEISSPAASPAASSVPVKFAVSASQPPQLASGSASVSFSVSRLAKPQSQVFRVFNTGGGSLPLSVSVETTAGGGWLTASADNSSLTPLKPGSVTVNASPAGLEPGTYTGKVLLRDGAGTTQVVPVTFAISTVPQTIVLSQTGLSFTAVQNGGIVPPQEFAILNAGAGAMDWSVRASTLSGGDWLRVSPFAGTSDDVTPPGPVVVQVNPAGLKPDVYYGQIAITSPNAANTGLTVSIVLNLLRPDENPGPVVQPAALVFSGVAGGMNPESQSIAVYNLTAASLNFGSGRAFEDGNMFFVHAPANASVTPDRPVTLVVQPVIAGLTPGIKRGALTFVFSDGSVRTIPILLAIAPGAASGAKSVREAVAGCSPSNWYPLFTTIPPDFNLPASWPVPLVARVIDDCGNPMTSGSVVFSFTNGDRFLTGNSLRDGRWSVTWTPRNARSQTTISAIAMSTEPKLQGSVSLSGSLKDNPNPPVVNSGGVVSGASFSGGAPLAPGTLISIFGDKLSDGAFMAPGLPLETNLQGVEVTMAGQKLPLIATSSGQINAIVPYKIALNTTHSVIVQRGARISTPEQVTLAETQPAIFTRDNSGKGPGVILSSGFQYFNATNPAKAGDTIVIYCSGLGAVDPEVPAGSAAPLDSLSRTLTPVSLTIGGVRAEVAFSGLAPGFAGVYQVNASVPSGVAGGEQPVVLTAGNARSEPVTLAIQQ